MKGENVALAVGKNCLNLTDRPVMYIATLPALLAVDSDDFLCGEDVSLWMKESLRALG